MTAATLTLTDFLIARIAEDEAVAREVSAEMRGLVEAGHYKRVPTTDPGLLRPPSMEEGYDGFPLLSVTPARVLAECEAKRRIVEREVNAANPTTYRRMFVLRDLASIYADHPDYRDEWRP